MASDDKRELRHRLTENAADLLAEEAAGEGLQPLITVAVLCDLTGASARTFILGGLEIPDDVANNLTRSINELVREALKHSPHVKGVVTS